MSTEAKVSSRELRRELQRQAIALQRLGEAASGDFEKLEAQMRKTRELFADLSLRLDGLDKHINRNWADIAEYNVKLVQRHERFDRLTLWGRLRWLVTGR